MIRTKEFDPFVVEDLFCDECGTEIEWTRDNQKLCRKCHSSRFLETLWQGMNPVQRLLMSAKARAKQYKLPFSITEKDIVIPDKCPIFGMKMKTNKRKGPRSCSPTLDRIIPELGYVPGNVAVISHRANRIKNNASANDHRAIADWMDAQKETAIA